MAYDEALADRIRRALGRRANITEKKMFGGVAFLLGGKMFCGVQKALLMVRVGPDGYEASLRKPHVRPMDFTGRPLKGYVYVDAPGCRTPAAVKGWVERGAKFAATLDAPKRKKNLAARVVKPRISRSGH